MTDDQTSLSGAITPLMQRFLTRYLKLAMRLTECTKNPNLDDVALLHQVGLLLQFHPNSYREQIEARTVDTVEKSCQTIGLRMRTLVKVRAMVSDNHLTQM